MEQQGNLLFRAPPRRGRDAVDDRQAARPGTARRGPARDVPAARSRGRASPARTRCSRARERVRDRLVRPWLDDRDRHRMDGIPCVGPFLARSATLRGGCRVAAARRDRRVPPRGADQPGAPTRPAVQLGKHRGAVEIRQLFTQGLLDQDGEGERQLARVELCPA
ncbi:MAG: hypothetical protein ACRDYA_14695 [Egibacteraceae bacterium]